EHHLIDVSGSEGGAGQQLSDHGDPQIQRGEPRVSGALFLEGGSQARHDGDTTVPVGLRHSRSILPAVQVCPERATLQFTRAWQRDVSRRSGPLRPDRAKTRADMFTDRPEPGWPEPGWPETGWPATRWRATELSIVAWGVGGVLLLLGQAIWRLTPIALDAIHGGLTAGQIALCGAWIVVNGYAEGYRAFQLRFSPRVVARAVHLARHPRPLHVALAPLFCMSFFHATPRGR